MISPNKALNSRSAKSALPLAGRYGAMRILTTLLLTFISLTASAVTFKELMAQYESSKQKISPLLFNELSMHQSKNTQVCIEALYVPKYPPDIKDEAEKFENFSVALEINSDGVVVNSAANKKTFFSECISKDLIGKVFKSELNGVRYFYIERVF